MKFLEPVLDDVELRARRAGRLDEDQALPVGLTSQATASRRSKRTFGAETRSPFDEGRLSFSPDGRFVTYPSNESGQYQIYVQEFPGGRKWPVTRDGGQEPVWIRDEIFYRTAEAILSVKVKTDPFRSSTPAVLVERSDIQTYDVSRDEKRFFLLVQPREPRTKLNVIQNWFQELEERTFP